MHEVDTTSQSSKIQLHIANLIWGGNVSGQIIGYRRVSSVDQNTERQLDGITLDEVFEDKVSGKDTNRPALQAMMKHARKGDSVLIHSMDRLARNVDDLRKLVKELTDKGAKVQFMKENLVFTGDESPMANLLLSLLGAIAEFERAIIKERQREGIQLAKARGAYKGRKQEMTDERIEIIRQRVANGEPKARIARTMGISRDTLYKYIPVG